MTESNAFREDAGASAGEKPRVSRMLQEAREAKNLDQKAVAAQLFLTATFIRYIDNGEFDKIPKPAFIKGYLRSYARVVGLAGDEVVAAYEEEQSVTPQAPQIGNLTEAAVGSGSITGPIVQTGIVGLIAVVVVGALVWWLGAGEETPGVTQTAQQENGFNAGGVMDESAAPAPMQETAAPAASEMALNPVDDPVVAEVEEEPPAHDGASAGVEPRTEPDTPAAAPVNQAMDETGQAEEFANVASEDSLALAVKPSVEIERVRDGETQYITVHGGGDQEMEFAFSDECWVQVMDGEGELIYRDLNRAGDVMTVHGIAPFEVLLGKAPAVRMTYEGQTVDLARITTPDQTATVRTARL